MIISLQTLKAVAEAIDKKDYREHLKNTCFSFDEESNTLHLVGTDSQVMIIAELTVREDDKEFCKKFFSDNSAYLITDAVLKSKNKYIEFTEIDNKLVADGIILAKYDGTYPRWQVVIPKLNLEEQTKFVSFKHSMIKRVNTAFGFKADQTGIEAMTPLATAGETQTPHIYKQDNLTAILMPVKR